MENREAEAGVLARGNESIAVRLNGFLQLGRRPGAAWSSASATALRSTCATSPASLDGPEEPKDYVFFEPGPVRGH